MIFLVLFGIPVLLALAGFVFLRGVTGKEFAIQVVAQALVAGAAIGIISCENTTDTEVWNGTVTSKTRDVVSCRHSYQCNCRQSCSSDSNGNQSCYTVCDTCYEHTFDVDWTVHDSTGADFGIDTLDRQGLIEPPRWASTVVGEPTSHTHRFTNYIKGAPDTLFRHQGLIERYASAIPGYPQSIYDYYRLDRLITVGVAVPDRQQWNADLSAMNGALGSAKQVNMIVVLVKDQPLEYFSAVEEAWIGGKKNDVVLFVDVDADMHPQWAAVMAWTKNELFKIRLRDDVMALPVATREGVLGALRADVTAFYQRKPMKDFAYLSGSIVPTQTEWMVTLLIALLIAAGLTWFFNENDVFGDERPTPRTRYARAWRS